MVSMVIGGAGCIGQPPQTMGVWGGGDTVEKVGGDSLPWSGSRYIVAFGLRVGYHG